MNEGDPSHAANRYRAGFGQEAAQGLHRDRLQDQCRRSELGASAAQRHGRVADARSQPVSRACARAIVHCSPPRGDVGRISAHIDLLALDQPVEKGLGPGTGNWGLLEAEDEAVTRAFIARAEQWLRDEGMTRVLAPISLSIWEEPGLLTLGHDHPPTIMMGHDRAEYQSWIENAGGYEVAKKLFTYDLVVKDGFPPIVNRIVQSGERSARITVIRRVDKGRFADEAEIFINILNEAWSNNWGFVPFTETEKAYAGKKLKPIIMEGTNMIAEVDGEPVAFMMSLPDLNP